MNTIYVWVLSIWMSGGPFAIDNISSQEECQRVERVVREAYRGTFVTTKCIQVQKVKP